MRLGLQARDRRKLESLDYKRSAQMLGGLSRDLA